MWQIRISDPSGETRVIPLLGTQVLGRSSAATIQLKDASVPEEAATLWAAPSDSPRNGSPFWLRTSAAAPSVTAGGFAVREAHLPEGVTFRLGETRLTIEPAKEKPVLPSFPGATKPWLTACEEGRRVLWTAKKAASTSLSVYLAGETGTGKEVLAHLLHAWSERASGPFVPLNCGALALSLAESELFGHVKGAFTGAIHQRPGALLQAHGGTLFLDEVGDLPMDIQVKLLRFLENGEIRPVGSDRPTRADVRILCATHHPLRKLVEEGRFRRDLYYRLASIAIEIPPVRGRPEDIRLLAGAFASELGRELSPRALLRLQAHDWPGNVRELRHAVERAVGLSGPFGNLLDEDAFEFLLTPDHIRETPSLELGVAVLTLEEMERAMLIKALRIAQGNRANAAKILGIARSTLFEMLKRHRIIGPRSKAPLLNSKAA